MTNGWVEIKASRKKQKIGLILWGAEELIEREI
jgi:hypothetical protein